MVYIIKIDVIDEINKDISLLKLVNPESEIINNLETNFEILQKYIQEEHQYSSFSGYWIRSLLQPNGFNFFKHHIAYRKEHDKKLEEFNAKLGTSIATIKLLEIQNNRHAN
jgi:hypothetical protein